MTNETILIITLIGIGLFAYWFIPIREGWDIA
jgi:antibiotic biosynthesis monooxygenase (ABM) superfamily enzyme